MEQLPKDAKDAKRNTVFFMANLCVLCDFVVRNAFEINQSHMRCRPDAGKCYAASGQPATWRGFQMSS
jgi:hypothetical protein